MENQIVTIHRSIRSLAPQVLTAFALAGITYLIIDRGYPSSLRLPIGSLGEIALPVWALVLLVFIARPLAFMFDCKYRISEHHVRCEWGRLSLKREEVEIAFENLKGVKMEQGLLERLLNVGSIIGWTGFPEEPDLVMHGIADPKSVLKLIGGRVDKAKLEQRSGSGGQS
jgi:uncharacterized membrane protein YdbT with pleckstrin-like domain